MKCQRINRNLVVTELPAQVCGLETLKVKEIEVEVGYAGQANALKAVILDNLILPAIHAALNDAAVGRVLEHLRGYLDQPDEVTPTALAEICVGILDGRGKS